MHISASVPLRHSTGFFPEPVIYIYMAGIFIPVYPHRTKRSKGCAFGKSWLYRYHFLVMRDHTLTFHLLSAELVAFKGLMYNFFFVFNNTSHNVFNVNCCHSWQSRLICVSLTVDIVFHFCPPALQAGFNKVQLFFTDVVRGWVWWAVHGVSALGERLVNGRPLTTWCTGNQALRWICLTKFTEGRETKRFSCTFRVLLKTVLAGNAHFYIILVIGYG